MERQRECLKEVKSGNIAQEQVPIEHDSTQLRRAKLRRCYSVIAGVILSLGVSGVFNPIWALEGQDTPTDSNPEEEIIEWDIRQNNGATMVADALLLEDEIRVTLQGKIVERIDRDHYRFEDPTGEIIVVLDEQGWNGIQVTAADTLLLQGEIKKPSFHTPVVYVDFLLKLE